MFFVREPTIVLVLKHPRRLGHGLKSPPTDWVSQKSNSGLLGTKQLTYPLLSIRRYLQFYVYFVYLDL